MRPSLLMHVPAGRLALAAAMLLAACSGDDGATVPGGPTPGAFAVDAGSLKMSAQSAPWQLRFHDAAGIPVLVESLTSGAGPVGRLGLHLGPPPDGSGSAPLLPPIERGEPAAPPARNSGWARATDVIEMRTTPDGWSALVATSAPTHRIRVTASAAGEGVIALLAEAVPPAGVQAVGIAFESASDERFYGFGERGNAVEQGGRTLEHYVGEGPYQDEEYAGIMAVVPKWGIRWREDATYFPIPWLLSSRGYGVLADNDELSYHRLRSDDAAHWSIEAEAPALRLRVFAGPTPAAALARFSAAVGRQPGNPAPWFFGPWLQADTDERIAQMLADDVPTSVAATYLHYLPCGSQQGVEAAQLERTAYLNAQGTAVHTYFNPMICTNYQPAYGVADAAGALIKDRAGRTYVYPYTTTSVFTVSQFDFAAPPALAAYRALTDEALAHGYEGWMEDFGEYTPLDAVAADGATGTRHHNRYARDYHCAVAQATAAAGKPLARFVRSGWTGSAACSPIVWGGDPTVGFGFDGLESSIYQALSMGTSGVGLWGSDIGGFFALGFNSLSDELLDRWIAFGALSVVMRSQKDGIGIPPRTRPQPWDAAHLPLWRKFAKLHTQLYPYLAAAAQTYFATGLPIMRHHVLTHADEAAAVARDDQYLLGADLLVAPVYVEGATTRELYLPAGRWVDFWRAVDYDPASGAYSLRADAAAIEGGRIVTVAAPIDEIPLFVRAGAQIPLLSADVHTLAEHGSDPAIVHLSDRSDAVRMLNFPR